MTATNATIPVFIFRSDVSMTAKMIWLDRSLESSIKRPDVIIDACELAKTLKKSVSTIRRALRELIGAGLIKFKSWVCKKLKVFTLNWQKPEPAKMVNNKSEGEEKSPAIAQNTKASDFNDVVAKEPAESSFVRDEKGRLCFRAEEENEVREVAYKLVDIGLSQEGAIEFMCKKRLSGCKALFNELAFLEAQGEIIEDKVGWFMERV